MPEATKISPRTIRALWALTDVPLPVCKRTLEECDGDLERAHALLYERGTTTKAPYTGRHPDSGIVREVIFRRGPDGRLEEVVVKQRVSAQAASQGRTRSVSFWRRLFRALFGSS